MPLRSGTDTSIHPSLVLRDSLANTRSPPLSRNLAGRGSLDLPPGPERSIEVEGGANKGQVCEGLREVAQCLAARPNLLRIKPQVVGVREHLFEDEPGFLNLSCSRQRLDEPERAQTEGALLTHQAVGRLLDVVAVNEAIGDQPAVPGRTVDGVQGA